MGNIRRLRRIQKTVRAHNFTKWVDDEVSAGRLRKEEDEGGIVRFYPVVPDPDEI
jgi:hypothetical protein